MDKKTGPLNDAKLEQVSGGASQAQIEESSQLTRGPHIVPPEEIVETSRELDI